MARNLTILALSRSLRINPRSSAFGNTLQGAVAIHDSHGNIAIAKKRLIALCGVRDLIVVETGDAAEQIKLLQPNLPIEAKWDYSARPGPRL